MEYILDGHVLTYSIESDGYYIYMDGKKWIHQYEPYIPNQKLSYEQNAIHQIEDMIKQSEEEKKRRKTLEELQAEVEILSAESEELYEFSADLLEQICLNELGMESEVNE